MCTIQDDVTIGYWLSNELKNLLELLLVTKNLLEHSLALNTAMTDHPGVRKSDETHQSRLKLHRTQTFYCHVYRLVRPPLSPDDTISLSQNIHKRSNFWKRLIISCIWRRPDFLFMQFVTELKSIIHLIIGY